MRGVIEKQREFYHSNQTKSLQFRKEALLRLRKAIKENETLIYKALMEDLNKSETESYMTEVQLVLGEIQNFLHHIDKWQKPKKVKTPLSHFPANSYIYRDPYGVVLILSPWNYPFQLAMVPLVGAVATGNCVMLKTSRSSRNVSNVIKKIVQEAFKEKHVYCMEADTDYNDILEQKYDFIFFTGSEAVGKKVMRAASNFTTPLVLELGGKSPCIIEKSADIRLAAKRLAWGKFLNAGQTCVAPDYIVIDQSVKEEFIKEFVTCIRKMYGNSINNKNYPKIINEHHYDRLKKLIDNYDNKIGGKGCREKQKIEPTIFLDVKFSDEIMKEEIFGPIMPVISYNNLKKVLDEIKRRPRPLAFYLFSNDKRMIEKILCYSEFGGGCVNDVVMHLANHYLPFGGLGSSGMGNYHGKFSFDTFTHSKAVLKSKPFLDVPLRYPPYTKKKQKAIRRIVK